ncbi:SDR family NAD(P)-dependent oxidoreductase [Burkholderia alba]|uniref:SDR family NAD(P)-dependent oxidoreductase n=1 Tax=Burkholderia alba TaxID=2683677 RepID=UPI002B05D29D|nr:SDR family oxidoreductase [Burkholderia alba]
MSQRQDCTGLRVAITGGTSGLGRALVDAWHARGAQVALVARDAARVHAVAAARERVIGIAGDISDKASIHGIALQMMGLLGGIDVLVNNASSLGPVPLALLADTDCEAFETALATNLLGPFRLTRALLGALASAARETGAAAIVNVSSDAAVSAYPGWGAYGASKAALRHLSAIWRAELAPHRIACLSFDPGDMDTPLHALAVPDADRRTLRAPAESARECIGVVTAALHRTRRPAAVAGDA